MSTVTNPASYPLGLHALWKARKLIPTWLWVNMLLLVGIPIIPFLLTTLFWGTTYVYQMLSHTGILLSLLTPSVLAQGLAELTGIELRAMGHTTPACANDDSSPSAETRPTFSTWADIFHSISSSERLRLTGLLLIAAILCAGLILQIRDYAVRLNESSSWAIVFSLTGALFSYVTLLIYNRLLCYRVIHDARQIRKSLASPTAVDSIVISRKISLPVLAVVSYLRNRTGESRITGRFGVASIEVVSWLFFIAASGFLMYLNYHPLVSRAEIIIITVMPFGWSLLGGIATVEASWRLLHQENALS